MSKTLADFHSVQIGDCTLYLGDCLEVMPLLCRVDCPVDAIVTDPPYGIADKWVGGFGHGWGKARDESVKRNQWDAAPPPMALIWAWRRERIPVVVWGGNYFELGPSRGWLVWNKPERNFSLAEAELAWTNIDMRVRVIDYPRSEPDRKHPTQKPLEVMRWSIEKIPNNPQTILDPFMGSGTTLVACAKLGRKGIGIEIDPDYFEIAIERVRKAYAQPDLFVAPPSAPVQETMFSEAQK
jgi:DNA modification methylase